jgi:hypothetical protein
MKYFLRVVTLAYALSVLQGCASSGVFHPGEFSYAIINGSSGELDAIHIHWREYDRDFDDRIKELPSSSGKLQFGNFYDYAPARIPLFVEADWKGADGLQHHKNIDMNHEMPDKSQFAGTVFFKFFDNDVCVVPVPEWLEQRNERLGKATVP